MIPNQEGAAATSPNDAPPNNLNSWASGEAKPPEQACPRCSVAQGTLAETFVYAIGKLEMKFPTVGIEREFQQREAALHRLQEPRSADQKRGERIAAVLSAHVHLAQRVCYLFNMSNMPAYALGITSTLQREAVLEALRGSDNLNRWCVLIGRRGPIAPPSACGGILVPVVACDQFYTFTLDEWVKLLAATVMPALKRKTVDQDVFVSSAQEFFARIVASTENVGITDGHRALNYALMQHPGLFVAAASRANTHTLDHIETRAIRDMGSRRLVLIILTFLDRATGVPERLFCRIDVTEEWPFVTDSPTGRPLLDLQPFIDNAVVGMV
jgi:hypothetical protein